MSRKKAACSPHLGTAGCDRGDRGVEHAHEFGLHRIQPNNFKMDAQSVLEKVVKVLQCPLWCSRRSGRTALGAVSCGEIMEMYAGQPPPVQLCEFIRNASEATLDAGSMQPRRWGLCTA